MSETLHNILKKWLVELGKTSGYQKSYSGDSKPLTIQHGKWKDSYQPDVIWKYKGEICVFELAFTEVSMGRWREVAGEICLASMVEDCSQIFIIVQSTQYVDASNIHESRWTKYVSVIGKKVGLKHGAELIFIPYRVWEKENVDQIQKIIRKRLRKLQWI